jgi:hypothetical protein
MQKEVSTTPPVIAPRVVAAQRAPGRWLDVLIGIGLLLLPPAIFAPLASLRSTFYYHDVQHYFYPYHVMPAAQLAQGELPFWNPYAFSGLPLIGDGQTALFYPPNWLFFVLPGYAALNYVMLLQFSIAGVGAYLFARSLGLWRGPALLAALAYMFCGFMTARVIHMSILSGAALIPLAFWGVERALRTGTARWFAVAAIAVALQAVAGHPQVPVYTAMGLGLYTLVRAVERVWAVRNGLALLTFPLRLAGIYLLGYALAAIQLAPWVELGMQSPRAAGAAFDFVFGNSMVGSHWLLFLFPYLYGSIDPSPFAATPIELPNAVKLWEHSAYVGILPLGLALVGLLAFFSPPRLMTGDGRRTTNDEQLALSEAKERMTNSGQWAVRDGQLVQTNGHVTPSPLYPFSPSPLLPSARFSIIAFTLLLALGCIFAAGKYTPLADLIYATPVIGRLRDVERAIVLAAFALTMLAGFGMQRLISGSARRPDGRDQGALAAGITIVGALIALAPILTMQLATDTQFQGIMRLTPEDVANLQIQRPNAYLPLIFALVSAVLLFWWSFRRATGPTLALAVALVLFDMGSYAAFFNPTTDPQVYAYQPESAAFLNQDTEPFRKATFIADNGPENRAAQELLAVSWGMVYDIEDINGFNSLQPRRYTDYLFSPEVGDVSYGNLTNQALLQSESPILSSLNVKYVMAPRETELQVGNNFRQVYENEFVRIYENANVYPRAFLVDNIRAETNPQAVLQTVTANGFDGRREALLETTAAPAVAAPAPDDQVTLTRSTPSRIFLTTSTAGPRFLALSEMYFPGWRAYVNGVETPIYRTNYLFRGIVVPAGLHSVEFVHQPLPLMVGAGVSAVTLLVVLGMLVVGRRRAV